jgi:OOP family OmpA-OmpF porin
MRDEVPLVLGLLFVVLMTWACACRTERDISDRSATALEQSGEAWAQARASGRFVTLTGTAPSPLSAERAAERVASLRGVLDVDSEIELLSVADSNIFPLRSAMAASGLRWVGIERSDRTIVLSGIAATDSIKSRVRAIADSLWIFGPVADSVVAAQSDQDLAALNCRMDIYQRIATSPVEFASGRATVSAEGRRVLRAIASALRTCSTAKVLIEAHSDSTGDPEGNRTLSDQRALSVREYLIARGIEAERLDAVGYGDTRPLATNDTPEGREANRRVEFRIRL